MTCCKTSNKGNALPVACTEDDRADAMTWGDPERLVYGSLETAATDVQQFGDWQEMGADSLFRFEYRHKDDYVDGMGAAPFTVQLLVSDDEGDTYTTIALAIEPVPNDAGGVFYSGVVEGLISKGLSYKVSIAHSLLSWGSATQLPDGASIYLYSSATLTPTENQP